MRKIQTLLLCISKLLLNKNAKNTCSDLLWGHREAQQLSPSSDTQWGRQYVASLKNLSVMPTEKQSR